MKRAVLLLTTLLLPLLAPGQEILVGGAVTRAADVQKAEAILSAMTPLPGTDALCCTPAAGSSGTATLMLQAARFLLGTPYVASTLEADGPERLRISLTGTDCILFVETCLGLALTRMQGKQDFPSLAAEVRRSRYRDGRVSRYSDRIHYTTEWILQEEARGVLEDLTLSLGGVSESRTINYMSSNYRKYRQLAAADNDPSARSEREAIAAVEERLSAVPQSWIPTAAIPSSEGDIRSGDIICFLSGVPGLDIAHVGIACVHDGMVGFIHASQPGGKVLSDPRSIADYAAARRGCPGIKVLRVL